MILYRSVFIFLILSLMSSSKIAAQDWAEIIPSSPDAPAPRRNSAAVYDPLNHRLILFAGRVASEYQNDVWAFDLNANLWSDITPASGSAPAPRFTPNAIYDPVEHQMIIWSGQGAALYNDVWAFDLATETWSEFTPLDPKPNIRYGTAAVFDPLTRDLVTFAGFTSQGRFDDTWRFDVENSAWINVTPTQGNPLERCLHTASYDSANHRMIMFGGQQNEPLSDIWAFDLAQNSWAELTPATSLTGRYFATNIYDARNHRAIIFGGNRGSNGGITNEVWEFDLVANDWEQLPVSGNPPGAREGAVAIYIRSEDRMVIFGGRGDGSVLLNDTWSLNNLSQPTGIGADDGGLSSGFVLEQNYPNPFNPSTKIRFTLPIAAEVVLTVYNLLGQEIKTLLNESKSAGTHEITWDGTDQQNSTVVSGVYLYKIETGSFVDIRKMVLLR